MTTRVRALKNVYWQVPWGTWGTVKFKEREGTDAELWTVEFDDDVGTWGMRPWEIYVVSYESETPSED